MPDRTTIPLHQSINDIGTSDLLLFRSKGWISSLIRKAGRTEYSHAAKAVWWGDLLFCCEVRELKGGRAVTLESQVKRFPGQIDVFGVAPFYRKHFDLIGSASYMKSFAGCDYGYWSLLKASFLHLPFIRFFTNAAYDIENYVAGAENGHRMQTVKKATQSRSEAMQHQPYCSQAVALADRLGGGVDPVPLLADRLTEPGDLSRSHLYEYKFTLSGV